ncbi:MAG: S8 family serine peptidase [Bryobacteraceae bacterium]|nr:S8 family serine peptidase [Bryobacteraceae bacterium]
MAERHLRARRARVLSRIDTVLNAVVVEAPDADALRTVPGVRRVTPVRAYELFLNRALVNHHAAEAWDLSGGADNAGRGVKIAILDTGIDPRHPGFQPPEGWSMPEGYPRVSRPEEENRALTNAKIIVARSFDGSPARDQNGHGTAVAMVAAGVRHESPRGPVSGMAPSAWLGVYRVSNPGDGLIYSNVVLEALDWAVKDGMDVINMSFGSIGATSSLVDPLADALRNAVEAGIVVVNAAGNTAGPMTVDDTAANERVLGVGSNNSTPADVTQVIPSRGLPMPAAASSNVVSLEPVMAPLVDAARFGDPLGCREYPRDALTGRIPLIERGNCTFSTKLANAARAGAPAAIIFNSANPPNGDPESLVVMNVDDNPTIPGLFIRRSDGLTLKEWLPVFEDLQVTLRFPKPDAVPNVISSFSSRGPSVDLLIKPDLLATGSPVYTAAIQADAAACDICHPSGYATVSGTSFSAPLVAGAAAVLKAARPGLGSGDYRSLLVNAAQPFVLSSGSTAPVNSAGAGMLNVKNSMLSLVAAAPVSISFGAGGATVDLARELKLKNLSDKALIVSFDVESSDPATPLVEPAQLELGAGETAGVKVKFAAAGLAPGAYQGFLRVRQVLRPDTADHSGEDGGAETAPRHAGEASGTGDGDGGRDGEDGGTASGKGAGTALPELRIPYWYAVQGGAPDSLVVVRQTPRSARPSSTVRVYFRIHDRAGLPLTGITPRLAPVSGGGRVVRVESAATLYPGAWLAELFTGAAAGPNVFQVEVDGRIFSFQIVTSN